MIPISSPIIGEDEKNAALEVLSSGKLVQGPRVEEFETKFAALCGVRHAIAVSSGTTALHVALLAHGIGEGDEVITTPFSFVATANSILYTGASPVFVDIEQDTFNIDPTQIEQKISSKTKAILPVHLYGQVANMSSIMEIADRHGLAVIEDACQAHAASAMGRRAGSFGTGTFSFYATKNMTTIEGGMITTNDSSLARTARMLREHGSEQRYLHEMLGYNFRMTDLQAAIGLAQLKRLPEFNQRRIENARYLTEGLADLKNVRTPEVLSGNHHVFHQYTIRCAGERDSIADALRSTGIGIGVYYPLPIHKQPLYKRLGFDDFLPVSEKASREVLSLPVHPSLSKQDLQVIVREVTSLC